MQAPEDDGDSRMHALEADHLRMGQLLAAAHATKEARGVQLAERGAHIMELEGALAAREQEVAALAAANEAMQAQLAAKALEAMEAGAEAVLVVGALARARDAQVKRQASVYQKKRMRCSGQHILAKKPHGRGHRRTRSTGLGWRRVHPARASERSCGENFSMNPYSVGQSWHAWTPTDSHHRQATQVMVR